MTNKNTENKKQETKEIKPKKQLVAQIPWDIFTQIFTVSGNVPGKYFSGVYEYMKTVKPVELDLTLPKEEAKK